MNKLKQQLGRSGCTLKEFKLPEPDNTKEDPIASLIVQETSYNKENLLKKANEAVRLMNNDQLDVFNDVIAPNDENDKCVLVSFCLGSSLFC